MRSFISSQCRDRRTAVMWLDLEALTNITCKRVQYLLEPGDLRLGQVVIKRVAVVKLGVNNKSSDGGSCFGIEVWTDTAKLTNMVIASFGDRWDLIRMSGVFIKYEAEVSSRVSGVEWVVDFGSCSLRPMSRNSVLEEFSVTIKICSHPGRDSSIVKEIYAGVEVSQW